MYPCPDKAVNTSPFQEVAFRVLKCCIGKMYSYLQKYNYRVMVFQYS